MKIFAGNGCPTLAHNISKELMVIQSELSLTKFLDGEINVEIKEHVRGEDVFIIQSTCKPANDNLMELATIADALRRSDAHRIVAVIPYYGYARQDRRMDMKRTPITSRLVADLLQAAGINYVITVDIHSDQQQGFFNVPFVNVSASSVLVEHMNKNRGDMSNIVTVSPDLGGVKRARNIAVSIGNEHSLAIIDKRRPEPNVSEVMNIIGDVEGKRVILVDDMIDTAGTLCKAAEALKNAGALEIYAYATHGVLSGDAIENIESSFIDKTVVTDTIPLSNNAIPLLANGKISVVSVCKLLANTITRINKNRSISEMYNNV